MNDRTLTPELQRTAAFARMRSAKDAFTKAAVSVLRARPGAEDETVAALAELNAARADLQALNAEETQP